MTSLQFVERRQGDAPATIDLILASGQQGIRDALAEGLRPLLWGSWDLAKIASRLVHGGARAVEATLTNSALDTLRGAEAEEAASEIVDALNLEDLDAVASDLDQNDLLLAAITISLPNVGLIRLIQNGQADVLNNISVDTVLRAMRPAVRTSGD